MWQNRRQIESLGGALFSGRALWSVCGLVLLSVCVRSASAQIVADSREYPPRAYYVSLGVYNEGEFTSAVKAFRAAASAGLRSTEGRWVDSICYHAMVGECLYQLGDLSEALDQYTAALNLFLAYPDWMLRVEFPPAIAPEEGALRRPITWGTTTRRAVIGHFSDRYSILQGRLDNADVIRQGGVVALPQFMVVNVHEIVRCTALAIRRRREIMGIACPHDPLTAQLSQTLSLRPAPPNHWSQAWVDVLVGLAYASEGKRQQAVAELTKSIAAGGTFDHPLTPTALIELGKLAVEEEQYAAAATFFLEATYSAACFSQYDVLEEAFRWAALMHLVSGAKNMYPPLEPATAWSRRMSRLLEASLLVSAAQNAAELQQSPAAAGLIEQARRAMGRTELSRGAVGARLNHAAALVSYQTGNLAAGDTALAAVMAYQQRGSHRLFEIGLVDRLFTSNAITDRVANDLYSRVLREPTARDWALDPVETLSVILTPHLGPLENWLELTWLRKEYEQAYELADRIRRRRFYATLPMGGRFLALRWVLEAPPELLSDQAKLQRQDLFGKLPDYAELSRRSAMLYQALKAQPLVPDGEEALRERTKQFTLLATLSQQQALMLREIALRRVPSEFAFPPQRDFKQIQAALPKRALVLSFLATSRGVYVMGMSKDKYSQWKLQQAPQVRKEITELLRQMGHVDRNLPVDPTVLRDNAWKETAARLLAKLTNDAKPGLWSEYDEMIIVPDSVLWYLPFEALQVVDGDSSSPLLAKLRIRYAPTLSLIPPDPRGLSPLAKTSLVAGRLFPRDDGTWTTEAVDKVRHSVQGIVDLRAPLPVGSGLFVTLSDRVVVLADADDNARGPYDWSPLQIDQGKPGSTLGAWLTLPCGGPQQMVLPGFHTAAEVGLKRGGNGEEVFLSVCGLMACGARTVLLSRWRTGGQTSYDLVREFLQELPFVPAAEAWQRSVQLLRDDEVVLEREPRVKAADLDVGIKADHPFFWAGYLLVDTGGRPKTDAAPAKPGAKAKPDAKAEAKVEAKPEAKADAEPEPKADAKPDAKPEADVRPDAKPEAKAAAKSEAKPKAEAKTK